MLEGGREGIETGVLFRLGVRGCRDAVRVGQSVIIVSGAAVLTMPVLVDDEGDEGEGEVEVSSRRGSSFFRKEGCRVFELDVLDMVLTKNPFVVDICGFGCGSCLEMNVGMYARLCVMCCRPIYR